MKKISFATFAAALLCAAAFAQGPPPGAPHGREFGLGPVGAGPGFGIHPGKVVTGAPYSATVSNSSIQTLQDGNTIQHNTTGSIARDRLGRTYEQVTFNGAHFGQNGPTSLIFINDPVAGYAYTLNAGKKIAFRRAIKAPPNGAHWREHRPEGGPNAPDVVTSDLGTQTIGGVTATGKSVTHTIPAGALGNALAISSTTEIWTSPDLQIPVLAKRTDPRFGQSTYSLTNIQRSDPAASLFQVPSDYTVKDEHRGEPRGQGGPPPPPEQ